MRLKSTLCLLLLIASPVSINAVYYQGTTPIKGTLLDPNDAVIPRGRIIFRSSDRQTHAYTTEAGVFDIELTEGVYVAEIEAPGFKKLVVTNLEVTIWMTKELKFQLEPLPSKPCPIVAGDEQLEIVSSRLSETIKPRKIQ